MRVPTHSLHAQQVLCFNTYPYSRIHIYTYPYIYTHTRSKSYLSGRTPIMSKKEIHPYQFERIVDATSYPILTENFHACQWQHLYMCGSGRRGVGVWEGGLGVWEKGRLDRTPYGPMSWLRFVGSMTKNVRSLVEKSQGKIREMRSRYRKFDFEIDIVLLALYWVRCVRLAQTLAETLRSNIRKKAL